MNEEVQRQMDFIVAQQAQFSVDIQQLKETQAAEAKLWREKHNALTDAITSVVGMVGKLAKAQDRTDKQLSELTNKQAETDDRLNALIHVVESQVRQWATQTISLETTSKPNQAETQIMVYDLG